MRSSVAYIVCDALGFDTSDYSFAYLARWSDGNTELVKDTAERVIDCAKQILEDLEASGAAAEAVGLGRHIESATDEPSSSASSAPPAETVDGSGRDR